MIPIRAVTDGAFGWAIQRRMERWAEMQQISARVRASAKLAWWKWQEFGIPHDYTLKKDPTGKYQFLAAIWRKGQPDGADALHFEYQGENVTTVAILHHGGLPARRMVQNAIPSVREQIHERFVEAVRNGALDNPAMLQDVVLTSTKEARELIKASFALHLDGPPRENGRLQGRSVEDVFEQETDVVNGTE